MEGLKGIILYPWRLRERRIQERAREANLSYEQSKKSQREIKELLQTLVASAEATEGEGKRVIKHILDPVFFVPTETSINFQSILPKKAPLISLSAGVEVDEEGYVKSYPYLTLVFKEGCTFHAHSMDKLFLIRESKQPINFWRKINEETEVSRWRRHKYAGTPLGNHYQPETYLEDILSHMEDVDEILNLLRQSAS